MSHLCFLWKMLGFENRVHNLRRKWKLLISTMRTDKYYITWCNAERNNEEKDALYACQGPGMGVDIIPNTRGSIKMATCNVPYTARKV